MSALKFTFDDLHLLWPRADGAVRFLSYLLKPIQNGDLPRFTDKYLGRKFHKHPETVARWRARWKKKGILKADRRGGYTYYDIDLAALADAIQAARAAQEQVATEARAQALARRCEQDAQVAQDLRQQCRSAINADRHFADFEVDQLGIQQRTSLKESFVIKEPGKTSGEQFKSGTGELKRQNQDTTAMSDRSQDHQWFLAAAQRLVMASGEKWNKTLQKALTGLDGDRLINVISSFWEQTLKGNIQNAPKWLNKAAQNAAKGMTYRPSQKFRLPSQLPPLVAAAPVPAMPVVSQSCLPLWLPSWAKAEVENLLKTIGSADQIFEVDGGIQLQWAGQQLFLADPQGPFQRGFC